MLTTLLVLVALARLATASPIGPRARAQVHAPATANRADEPDRAAAGWSADEPGHEDGHAHAPDLDGERAGALGRDEAIDEASDAGTDHWIDGRTDGTDGWTERTDGQTDGTDEWTDGTDGEADGAIDREADGAIDREADGWAGGWTDGWTDGWIDGWTDGGRSEWVADALDARMPRRAGPVGRLEVSLAYRRRADPSRMAMPAARHVDELWLVATWSR